jgi:glutamate/tyrosine decarboxylase-like PLP-dependent enzyme
MTAAEFRQHGHALVDTIATFLSSAPQRPVTSPVSPDHLQQLLGGDTPIPESGMDTGALLREATELLFDHSLLNGHPKFFGYITSSPAPIGMFGDLLAAAVNANVGSYRLGPMASEIEAQTVRWIADGITAAHLRLGGSTHLASQGGGSRRTWHRCDSLDCHGCIAAPQCAGAA